MPCCRKHLRWTQIQTHFLPLFVAGLPCSFPELTLVFTWEQVVSRLFWCFLFTYVCWLVAGDGDDDACLMASAILCSAGNMGTNIITRHFSVSSAVCKRQHVATVIFYLRLCRILVEDFSCTGRKLQWCCVEGIPGQSLCFPHHACYHLRCFGTVSLCMIYVWSMYHLHCTTTCSILGNVSKCHMSAVFYSSCTCRTSWSQLTNFPLH